MAWGNGGLAGILRIAGWTCIATLTTGGMAAACAKGGSNVDETTSDVTETTGGGMGGNATGMGGTPPSNGGMGGDGGSMTGCTEDPCKLQEPQCGCPDAQKCSLLAGSRACRAAGTKLEGEICGGDAECAPGTYCLNIGDLRTCRKFCDSDTQCELPGGQCRIAVSTSTETVCSENCDLVTGQGCDQAGSKCEGLNSGGTPVEWYTACVAEGAGLQGDPCTTLSDCASGFGCLTVNMVSSCHQWCNLLSPACPGAAPTCQGLGDPLLIGAVEYGGCL